MQLGHAVDLVGSHDGEEGHANHLLLRLLDNGDTSQEVAIVGEGALHALEEEQVDVVDDLEVTRE